MVLEISFFANWRNFTRPTCEGRPARLPELPVQYSDYAAWQRQRLNGDALLDQLNYWKTKLASTPPMTELMTDRPARARANI